MAPEPGQARAPAAGSAHPHNPDAANEGQSSVDIASRSTVVSAKGTCLSGQSSGKQERRGLGAAAAAKGTVFLSQLPSPDGYRDQLQREGRAAAAWRLRCSCVGCWKYPPSPQMRGAAVSPSRLQGLPDARACLGAEFP